MSTISSGTTSTTTLVHSGDTTGSLVFKTNDTGSGGTTAVTLDTSQNATFAGYVNSPNTFGFKNRIINGSMAIDQRNSGASQTITSGAALAYTVDRWYAWTTGANGTVQRVAGTAPSQYGLKFTGATSNTLCGIAQRIEQLNSYDLASDAVTISAYMTASTNTTITAVLNGPSSTADTFGTIASPTVTQIATTTFSVTTTRTLFTWTVSAASMSGFNKGLELIFKAASGLGNAVTWTIESVQLEKGSTATSFDYRPYGTELQLCQRFYSNFVITTDAYIGTAQAFSSTAAKSQAFYFKVSMRTAPTITLSTAGNSSGQTAFLSASNSSVTVGTHSAISATTEQFLISCASYSGTSWSAGTATSIYATGAQTVWAASAEL